MFFQTAELPYPPFELPKEGPELAKLIDKTMEGLGYKRQILDRRGVGVGKTEDVLRRLVDVVPTLLLTEAIYIFLPTTDRCEEIAMRLVALDERLKDQVLVYRGRQAPRPDGMGSMCAYADAAAALDEAGGDPAKSLCNGCRYKEDCAYLTQAHFSGIYPIIVLPHAMLSLPKRHNMRRAGMVIIDEDPTGALLEETEFYLDELVNGIPLLSEIHRQLIDSNGAIQVVVDREEVRSAIKECRKQANKDRGSISANPTESEVIDFRQRSNGAMRALRIMRFLKAILRSITENVIGCRIRLEGKRRVVSVKLKHHVHADYEDAATLILSATAEPDVLRHWWWRLDASADETQPAPFEHVSQYVVKATKKALQGPQLLKRVVTLICMHAELHGEGLVVCQKDVEDVLRPLLPSNVHIAHFFAVAGSNKWQHVRWQMIIGRPMPHPTVLEQEAEAITGKPVDRHGVQFHLGWYPKRTINIGRVQSQEEWHPDLTVYGLLRSKCFGEIVQADRARGLRRDEDTPLNTVYVGAMEPPKTPDDVTLGMPFGPKELMAARGLVIDTAATHNHWSIIAAVVPEWFETPKAAQRHFQNAQERVEGELTDPTAYKYLYAFGSVSDVPFSDPVKAKITIEGLRYATPVWIDPAKGNPIATAKRLLGGNIKIQVL